MDEIYMELPVKRKPSPFVKLIKGLLILATVLMSLLGMIYLSLLFVSTALAFCCIIIFPLLNFEYEYLYEKEKLSIERIYSGRKRKKVVIIDLNHMEVLAPLGSHRLDAYKNAEVLDYSAKDKEQNPYAMIVASKKGIKKVLLQFDEDMVNNLRSSMPRKVFFD